MSTLLLELQSFIVFAVPCAFINYRMIAEVSCMSMISFVKLLLRHFFLNYRMFFQILVAQPL